MIFDVVVPIDGYETEKKFKLSKIDDFFSIITGIDTEVTLKLMSFGALKSISFQLPEDFKNRLKIENIEDLLIFYIFVLQPEVSNSSMNIFSPIIINKKSKKMGQIHLDLEKLGLESLNDILPKY